MNKKILFVLGLACAGLGVLITIGIFIYTATPARVPESRVPGTVAQPVPENSTAIPVPTPVPLPAVESISEPLSPTVVTVVAPETTGQTPDAGNNIPAQTVNPVRTPEPQKTVPELIGQLQDADAKVRRRAVSSLERLSAKEAIPDIKKLVADPDPKVRRQAEKTLRQLGVSDEELERLRRDRAYQPEQNELQKAK